MVKVDLRRLRKKVNEQIDSMALNIPNFKCDANRITKLNFNIRTSKD